MKSRFHEEAGVELTKAVEYYEQKASDLGDRLLAEVRAAVAHIEQFPRAAKVIEQDIRGKVLVRFPHTLLYAIEKNMAVILAVAHQSQNPEEWREIVHGRRPGAQ